MDEARRPRWTAAELDAALAALLAADAALKETRLSSDEQLLTTLVLALCAPARRAARPERRSLSPVIDAPSRHLPRSPHSPRAASARQLARPAHRAPPHASASAARLDSVCQRAPRLVSEGNGAAGRALVDSLLRAARGGNAGVRRRAVLARRARRDGGGRRARLPARDRGVSALAVRGRRAAVARRAGAGARRSRRRASQHLQRFVREHPVGPRAHVRGLAAARLAFEQRDATRGCAMIADARASVAPTDVELRNQIDYYGARCPTAPRGVAPTASHAVSTATPSVRTSVASVTSSPPPSSASSTPATPPRRRRDAEHAPPRHADTRRDQAPDSGAPRYAPPNAPRRSPRRGISAARHLDHPARRVQHARRCRATRAQARGARREGARQRRREAVPRAARLLPDARRRPRPRSRR